MGGQPDCGAAMITGGKQNTGEKEVESNKRHKTIGNQQTKQNKKRKKNEHNEPEK